MSWFLRRNLIKLTFKLVCVSYRYRDSSSLERLVRLQNYSKRVNKLHYYFGEG